MKAFESGAITPAAARAAQYVRMSTESQVCSPHIQREMIGQYALAHGIEIVRSYADEGKSGLTLKGREGLRSLLADIQRGDHGFSLLLVYDVSRWGRFQDSDEGAYYEFQCRKAGVKVVYCAEAFENDSTPYTAVVKSLKRIMAAEYSRELSTKIYLSQRRWAGEGFYMGGSPGYGRRRLLLDETGVAKMTLRFGDRKGLRSDRVVIVPGPPDEVAIVNEIYRLFVEEDLSSARIAERLNSTGRLRPGGRPWGDGAVYKILQSDKYAGANIYARGSHKLKGPFRRNPPDIWVQVPDAFPSIVDPEIHAKARTKMQAWTRRQTDDELLERLRDLWNRRGRLTRAVIEREPDMPSASAYQVRFGSLNRAFSLIGHPCSGHSRAQQSFPNTFPARLALIEELRQGLEAAGIELEKRRSRILTAKGEVNVGTFIADHEVTDLPTFPDLWRIRFARHPRIDVGVLGRLAPSGETILDWFVIPFGDVDVRLLRHLNAEAAPITAFRVKRSALIPTVIREVRARRAPTLPEQQSERIRPQPRRPARAAPGAPAGPH